jgi:hypothetical protein
MTIYYKTTKGSIIRNTDLEDAYLIATGKYRWESERDYLLWLNSIWGKYVISAHKANELSIEEIARDGQTFMAVCIYKELHNCDTREAYDAVKKMSEV